MYIDHVSPNESPTWHESLKLMVNIIIAMSFRLQTCQGNKQEVDCLHKGMQIRET